MEDHSLVMAIYQAVTEPEGWPEVLDQIARKTASLGAIIFEWRDLDDQRRLCASHMTTNYDPNVIAAYVNRYAKVESSDQDMFEKAFLSRYYLEPDDVTLVCEEVLYADEAKYRSQPHVQELNTHGIAHRYGALLNKDNPDRARFTIQRTESKGLFSEEELRRLTPFLDHCAKSLEMSLMVQAEMAEKQALLDGMNHVSSVGLCVLDGKGRVVARNDEFQRHRQDLKAFRGGDRDRIAMANPADDAKLSGLLDNALNHGRFGARPRKEAIIAETGDRDAAICVDAAPFAGADGIGSAPLNGTLLVTRDTTRPVHIDTGLAAKTFGLTDAEGEVMTLVSDGLTNAEIAERREVSPHTINVQVKEILRKADARCRPEINTRTKLVRILCNFAAPPPASDQRGGIGAYS